MGITSSQELLKEALVGINLIEVDEPEIHESGTFVLYDGGPRTAMATMSRNFAVFCAGFSMMGESGLKQMVETIEHQLYLATKSGMDVEHTHTSPLLIAENGLMIYRIDVKIIDMES